VSMPPGERVAGRLAAEGRPVPDIVIEPDADRLARSAASAFVARLSAAQQVHDTASVVLTGGRIGIEVLRQVARLAAEPEHAVVDWHLVDIWWGDERFVPADDPERNERGARQALIDVVGVPDERVHAMPPSDGPFADPDDAAAWYAQQLAAVAAEGQQVPHLDLLLLGMGAEGHVASIFPETPAVTDERPVFAVRDSPKPPPTRISLGFSAINAAEEVWLLVSGEEKAEAVARALRGEDPVHLPAAGVHGRRATRWLLDAGAASRLSRPS
jgi:6-phosphogluconolactonase